MIYRRRVVSEGKGSGESEASVDALPESLTEVRALADAFGLPLFLLDRERRIRAANPVGRAYAERLFGRPLRLGASMDDFSVPEALEAFRLNHARALEGEPVTLARAIRYPNGEELSYRIGYQPVRGGDGSVQHVLFFAEDLTEGLDAMRRNRLYEAALDQSRQGVAIGAGSEPGFPLMYVSQGFERLTGYDREEILGRSCALLQGPGTDSETARAIGEALRRGRFHRTEILNYRKDGTPFWNDLTLFPVRDANGALTHYVGLQVDVTEHRRLLEQEKASERLKQLGLLAGGVAHDFNNLLAALRLNLELVFAEHSPDDATVDAIEETLARARALTDSLLALDPSDSREPRRVDLRERLEVLETVLRPSLRDEVALHLDLPTAPLTVRVDPTQLDQAVMNLVLNASKANSTTIVVRARLAEATGQIQLAVVDDGEGMTSEVRARALEPFFTTRPRGEGTGLGLATAQAAIAANGGSIAIESQPGEGTTVTIGLPASQP